MACMVYLENNTQDFAILKEHILNINDGFEIVHYDNSLDTISSIAASNVEVLLVSKDVTDCDLKDLVNILRRLNNGIKIILVSKKKEDAYDAMDLNLDGFLLKPIDEDNLVNVLLKLSDKLCTIPLQDFGDTKEIRMNTMPRFDMYVNGEPVIFRRNKGKELMAFLVNAEGAVVNGEMIIEALWPGEGVGNSQRNRCRVLVNCLKNFLSGLKIDNLFMTENGHYYLNKKAYTCDVDSLLKGDKNEMIRYNHAYMDEYEWAQGRKEVIERYLSHR